MLLRPEKHHLAEEREMFPLVLLLQKGSSLKGPVNERLRAKILLLELPRDKKQVP
jgi:hypothetical protein